MRLQSNPSWGILFLNQQLIKLSSDVTNPWQSKGGSAMHRGSTMNHKMNSGIFIQSLLWQENEE